MHILLCEENGSIAVLYASDYYFMLETIIHDMVCISFQGTFKYINFLLANNDGDINFKTNVLWLLKSQIGP